MTAVSIISSRPNRRHDAPVNLANFRNLLMTTGGLIVMVLSIGVVVALLTFCLYRIFTLPPVDND